MDKTRPPMLTVAEQRARNRAGRKSKDSAITDNFNMDKKGTIGNGEAAGKKGGRPPGKLTPEQKDEKASRQLLDDLRYAYRNAAGKNGKKGRARMVALMAEDGEFKFAVKEMMRLEIASMQSRLKQKELFGGGGDTTTFVILKGLQTEEDVMGPESKDLDLAQIADAINPTAQPKAARPEEEISRPEGDRK